MRRAMTAFLRAAMLLVVGVGAAASIAAAQSETIAPGPTLVADGIPPIPAALAADIRRYTEARSATLADWHPTRRELLITTRFGNSNQIHSVKTPGGARTQLTFADEPIDGAIYQPTEGGYFIFARDVGGNEFDQLYRYDVHTGRVTLLTDGGRSQNRDVIWNRKGTRIAYSSTRRNRADRDIYVMDPMSPSSDRRVLQVTGGGWQPLDWSPDESKLLVQEELSIAQSALVLVDVATGQTTALTPRGESVAYWAAAFSADGRGVYVTTNKDSEFQRLAYLDLATKALTPLTADIPWDIDRIELSPDGKTLAFVANEAGVSTLYVHNTGARTHRKVSEVPTGVIGSMKWHRALHEFGFTLRSARSPGDVYSYAPKTGRLTRWTESEIGGLVAETLSVPELVRWRSFDEREITGFYYRPSSRFAGRRPVLINIHGGPAEQAFPVFLGRSNYFVNELGIAIIFPNVRGSSGYGKTFLTLDDGTKREDSVKDIGALLDWIRTRPELDADRVMVAGGSYGGYMSLAVSTMYSDRIRCTLDVVGISNFNTFLKNTESYRRDLRRAEYGDERDLAIAAFFERTAPLNNAGKITRPLFVVQGGNDPRVPRTESEQMVARVKQNGTPVWYLMASDEGHGFAKKGNVDFQFFATVVFMKAYLLGDDPLSAPAKR